MWNLKYSTNEPAEQKQITDMENRLAVAQGEWVGRHWD